MIVHDRVYIRTFFVNGAVDEPLQIGRAAALVDRGAVKGIFNDIVAFDAFRRAGARQQITLRIVGMAGADMAEGIDDALLGQNAICRDQFFDDEIKLTHCAPSPFSAVILWLGICFVNHRPAQPGWCRRFEIPAPVMASAIRNFKSTSVTRTTEVASAPLVFEVRVEDAAMYDELRNPGTSAAAGRGT